MANDLSMPEDRTPLWRRFDREIDLYKFYLEVAVKGSLFAFGITGALTSYYFGNPGQPLLVWALILPIVLNFGFFVLFACSHIESRRMVADHMQTCKLLEIRPFNTRPLPALCLILAAMYFCVGVGLSYVVCTGM